MTNTLHFGDARRELKALGVSLTWSTVHASYNVYVTDRRKDTERRGLTLRDAFDAGLAMAFTEDITIKEGR